MRKKHDNVGQWRPRRGVALTPDIATTLQREDWPGSFCGFDVTARLQVAEKRCMGGRKVEVEWTGLWYCMV